MPGPSKKVPAKKPGPKKKQQTGQKTPTKKPADKKKVVAKKSATGGHETNQPSTSKAGKKQKMQADIDDAIFQNTKKYNFW